MKHLEIAQLFAACLLLSTLAQAEPSGTDRSLAQSLFEQGKQLMSAGKLAEACPKLQESQKLDPGGGTLLNLALCHERLGRTATAWAEFKEALSMARRDGRQERVKAAEEHIAAIEPKLPYLTLVASNSAGQELQLDGAAIGRAGWGSPLSVDPGAHEVSASAPGKKRWTQTVNMAAGEKRTVQVPELEADPAATKPAPAVAPPAGAAQPASESPRPSTSESTATRSPVGYIVGGAGLVALGVGGFFGLRTLSLKHKSDDECPTGDTSCSDRGVKYNEDAHTAAWISNVGIGAGLLGVGIGAYLILSDHGSKDHAVRSRRSLAFDAGPSDRGAAVHLRGTW